MSRRAPPHLPPTEPRQGPRTGYRFVAGFATPPAPAAPPPKRSAPKKAPPSPPQAAHAGDILAGRWKLEKRLGRGGMGEVWRARHVLSGKEAAVKLMLSDMPQDAAARHAFFLESRYDNVVNDATRPRNLRTGPGAVAVYDAGTSGGKPYIAMELLKGGTLRDVAAAYPRGQMDPMAAAEAMGDVLATIEAAHRQGIVHRDLKPENLFMTEAGDTKVMDFGLAKRVSERDAFPYFVGTPGFAPPEQSIGLADPRSDVWAAGATAYALVTGRPPAHPDTSVAHANEYVRAMTPELRRSLLNGERSAEELDYAHYPGCPVPAVQQANSKVPSSIARVIDKSLACDPSNRYSSAKRMRDDLRRAVEEEMAQEHLKRQNSGQKKSWYWPF